VTLVHATVRHDSSSFGGGRSIGVPPHYGAVSCPSWGGYPTRDHGGPLASSQPYPPSLASRSGGGGRYGFPGRRVTPCPIAGPRGRRCEAASPGTIPKEMER